MPDVASNENARLAGFQVKRIALESPRGLSLQLAQIGSSQDVTALIAAQPIADRRRQGCRPDQDKESLHRQCLLPLRALDHNLLEPLATACFDDRGFGPHRDAGVLLDAIDEIPGHLPFQRIAADEESDFGSEVRKKEGCLSRGVGAADDAYPTAAIRRRGAGGSAEVN